MQFAVPQFTDVEDKLIGPFTLKQFLIVMASGGLILMFWSILHLSFFFFIFALPTAFLGIGLAFGKFNGRPVFLYLGSFLSFFSKPQVRVFKREEPTVVMKMTTKKPVKPTEPIITEGTESRLKKLAYLLDQKTEEEKALLQK
ncbi:MAG TPA: PrgI family protein [Methylomirabilota bacterium]|jgi:hypothetical protein|nr:PrgI family protein [Methylomirabilota bacterium]